MDTEYTAQKQCQPSISFTNNAWRTEARTLPAVSMLPKKINHIELPACEHNRELYYSLNIFTSGLYLLLFLQTCLSCWVWVSVVHHSKSRLYPEPHRGERVKQGMVHPRNIAISTSQNSSVWC
jgi:hypothetical protein